MAALLPTFGILILNRNGKQWLGPLYESLRDGGYDRKRVYLVDNASDDGSVEMTRSQYPDIAVLRMPANLGYSMAYNAVMGRAFADGCDWVIWQNSDTLVLPGWLDRLAQVAARDAHIGVMGPVFRQWHSDGPNQYMRGNQSHIIPVMEDDAQPPIDCDWVEGSVCAVKRECIEDTGPLDPWLFFYWEEADFCRRARHRGWRVVIVPGSVCRHFAGGSTVTDRDRSLVVGLRDRNYYLYKLCDPASSFVRNLWRTLHLFAANQKHWLIDHFRPRTAWSHVRSFASVLFELARAWSKWRRDRTGGRPPKFTVEIAALVNRERIQ